MIVWYVLQNRNELVLPISKSGFRNFYPGETRRLTLVGMPYAENALVSYVRERFVVCPAVPVSWLLQLPSRHTQKTLMLNSSYPGQDGHHFTDDIFKCIFVNAFFCISILISLKFAPTGPINNKSVLVQVMAWRRSGTKPWPESMFTNQSTPKYILF